MDTRPIGVFDSGLGGLTAVRELRQLLPSENIIYFGDTARVPYGGRSAEILLKYARQDVRFLRSHASAFGIDPERIAVWGESCGGQLAALMAVEGGIPALDETSEWADTSSDIQGAVAWYGGFNIEKFTGMLRDPRFAVMYGGTWEEKRELVRAASPIQYASAKLCPILSMCSDSDVRVPYTQSVEFCQAASGFGNDARHVTVPNQGHGYFEGDEYYQMIYDFLDKHMK